MIEFDDALRPELTVAVDTTVYPLEAVYRACYGLTDRCYLWLDRTSDTAITVALTRKNANGDLSALRGEFGNLLIDHAVRRDINMKTAGIQEAIYRAAFSHG